VFLRLVYQWLFLPHPGAGKTVFLLVISRAIVCYHHRRLFQTHWMCLFNANFQDDDCEQQEKLPAAVGKNNDTSHD
jgi:hypothetical protein